MHTYSVTETTHREAHVSNPLDRIKNIPADETVTLTVPEVAHLLGRSEQLVRRWIRDGDLPAERIESQPGRPYGVSILALAAVGARLTAKKRRGVRRTPTDIQRARELAQRAAERTAQETNP